MLRMVFEVGRFKWAHLLVLQKSHIMEEMSLMLFIVRGAMVRMIRISLLASSSSLLQHLNNLLDKSINAKLIDQGDNSPRSTCLCLKPYNIYLKLNWSP